MDKTENFPTDWNAWRMMWDDWKAENKTHLCRTSFKFGGKNLLADEVLGIWRVGDRTVELSEVTFPDCSGHTRDTLRYIGITYGTGAGTEAGPLVRTFAELEEALKIAKTPSTR